MKKNIKKIIYTFVLSFTLVSVSTFAEAQISPLLHRGGGHQFVKGALSIIESFTSMSFGASAPDGRPAVFEKPAESNTSFFGVLGDSVIGGDLFVGIKRSLVPSPANILDSGFYKDGSLNYVNWTVDRWFLGLPALQKVNVGGTDGNILATNLKHTTGTTDNVCIAADGSLVICENQSGTTYLCLNAGFKYAHLCFDDDQSLSSDTPKTLVSACTTATKCEFICDTDYHLENGNCVANRPGYLFACDGVNDIWGDMNSTCPSVNYDISISYVNKQIVCVESVNNLIKNCH